VSEDAFEFFPCLIDGKPASIYVNVRFDGERPEGADCRYQIGIHMRDAGPHGIGTVDEAEALNAFEETAIAELATHGLFYVGRDRCAGLWEITFYGPAGHEADVRASAASIDRPCEVTSRLDPEWRYYAEILLPDEERLQWISDRRVVTVLREAGDNPSTPRRVDHWAYFPTAEARDAFVGAVSAYDFELESATDDGKGKRTFGAHVYRTDPVELDHIHDVVMALFDAAEQHGGEYDGWETSIER
jgi:hypothetical protein